MQPAALAQFETQRAIIEAEDSGKYIETNPRVHLKELIEMYLDGVDRSPDHIQHIRDLLNEQFSGTVIKEELEFYLAAYSSNPGKANRVDEAALIRTLWYVWSVYLSEDNSKDTNPSNLNL